VYDVGAVEFQALQRVNAEVTLQPDCSAFIFSRDTNGCPENHVDKFNFEASEWQNARSANGPLYLGISY
jgi:hypothetical protein